MPGTKNPGSIEKLLTVDQVAAFFGIAAKTVARLGIPAVRIGEGKRPRRRYRPEDVDRYVREHLHYVHPPRTSKGKKSRRARPGAILPNSGVISWEQLMKLVPGSEDPEKKRPQ